MEEAPTQIGTALLLLSTKVVGTKRNEAYHQSMINKHNMRFLQEEALVPNRP